MDLLDHNPSLRLELQRITEADPCEHRSRLEALTMPHSVRFVASVDDTPPGTCFAFALGLLHEVLGDPVLKAIATADEVGRDLIPDSGFVRWLWVNRILTDGSGGDLWLYFDCRGRPVHAARGDDYSCVTSKWGIGHVWQHAVDDVPASYGTHFARVRSSDETSFSDLYRRYLRVVYPIAWQEAGGPDR